MTRFPVLQPEEMTPEQAAVAAQIASGPRGGVRGPFVALLHNPALAERVQALGEHLRFGTTFPAAALEIAILVTARHWNCQYEWFAHEKIARKAGLDPAIIEAIAARRQPPGMTSDEALVHAFCTGVVQSGEPGEAAFAAAQARFGLDGALDLIALCGYYSLLAMVLNTARLPLPDGAPPPLQP